MGFLRCGDKGLFAALVTLCTVQGMPGKGSKKGVKILLFIKESALQMTVVIVFSFAYHVPASKHVLVSKHAKKTLKQQPSSQWSPPH